MQEADAQGRLDILRGKGQTPTAELEHDIRASKCLDHERQLKKRKIGGEDDTDRDIRLAKASNSLESTPLSLSKSENSRSLSDAPITDARGHISLFPEKQPQRGAPKNAETEAEKARKKQEYEDQYTMRFSNAAGFKQKLESPWYSSSAAKIPDKDEEIGKDVWGNEDRGRHSREKARLDANDPLAFMKKGVKQLKDVERDRRKLQKEQAQELESLRYQEHSRRRQRKSESDDLGSFSLDPVEQSSRPKDDDHAPSKSRKRRRERHSSDNFQEQDKHRPDSRHHHRDKHRSSRARRHGQPSDSDEVPVNKEAKQSLRSLDYRSNPESLNGDRFHQKPSNSAEQKVDGLGWRPGRGGRYSDQFAAAT